eukprot:s7332_g1.t1
MLRPIFFPWQLLPRTPSFMYVSAWITLTVHSSLEAVGLTAAFASALAREGISANVVAAFFHDHVFVDIKDAERAVATLQKMSKDAQGASTSCPLSERATEAHGTGRLVEVARLGVPIVEVSLVTRCCQCCVAGARISVDGQVFGHTEASSVVSCGVRMGEWRPWVFLRAL